MSSDRDRCSRSWANAPISIDRAALHALLGGSPTTIWTPASSPGTRRRALIGALVFAVLAGRADAAGGLTLGADPIAGAVAYYSQTVGAPIRAFTVRKEAKAHGMGRAIEGSIRPAIGWPSSMTSSPPDLHARRHRSVPAGRPYHYRRRLLIDREEGGLARIRAAVPGVPCAALFTRAELQRRLEEQRAAAR